MELNDQLALLNASLNATSSLCLVYGWTRIRAGDRDGHRKAMGTAFVISAIFLVSYLTRVALGGTHPYPGDGALRTVYLAVLISHIALAASVPYFAIKGIYLAKNSRFDEHRRLMRVGLPIWLYVSVTGVLVYLMLYGAMGALPF